MMLFLQLKIARLSASRTLLIKCTITRMKEKASKKFSQLKIKSAAPSAGASQIREGSRPGSIFPVMDGRQGPAVVSAPGHPEL